jgi:hypothetical protein
LTLKVITTDVALGTLMHKNCTCNLPQYLQNCIRREPIQNKQRNDTATPCCGQIFNRRVKYHLYLFCGARSWHLQNFLCHSSQDSSIASMFEEMRRPGKRRFIEVSLFCLFLPFSSHLFFLFISPASYFTISLDSTLRFRTVDWPWYFLNLQARNGEVTAIVTLLPLLSMSPLEAVSSLSLPQSMPPLMEIHLHSRSHCNGDFSSN